MRFRYWLLTLPLLTLPFLSLSCGGEDEPKSDVTIEVKATGLRYEPASIVVPAGKTVRLKLNNIDEMEHDLEVQSMPAQIVKGSGNSHGATHAGKLAVHTPKKKQDAVTFIAQEKGTYPFWCTIAGHKELGMIGEITVN